MINSKNNIKKFIIIGCLIIFIVFLFFKFRSISHFLNIRHIKHFILSYGKFSSIAFVIVYSIKPVIFILPASLLSIVAGNIFGPAEAFGLSMIGCYFSATLAFFLSRKLGKPFVDKVIKGKIMELDDSIEKHGFMIMLLMRLCFIFPYDPLSYAAGLTKMKYKDFILGTMLGMIPELISYSLMGHNMNRPFSKSFYLPILGTIIIAIIASFIYNKYKNKNK